MDTKLIKKLETCIKLGNKITCTVNVIDLQRLIQEYKNIDADLYEANNRINDLLLILENRDRMIDLMVNAIYKMDCESEYGNSKEVIRKYFEERCK